MRETIKKYLQDHYNDYVKDLEILTNIDSGNGDREGTEAANKFVAQHMEAMGATTEYRYNDRACHLISRLKGEGELTVLLVAHVDTVFNKGEAAKRPFRVDENGFAWGPGVGDDKATVMEVIYGLKALQEAGFKNFKEIIYYTNGEEEGGSKTAEEIVAELSQQSDFAIIMDVARPNWGIVTQRKSNAKYRVEVTGIGGHHGNASQHCANAIHQLAYTITEIHKLASPMPGAPEDFTAEALKARGIVDAGQFIPQNTVNVGVIGSTNDKISVIPGDAFCEVNIRCFSTAEQARIDEEIKALEDFEFWVRYLYHNDKIMLSDEIGFKYRMRDDSRHHSLEPKQRYLIRKKIINLNKEIYDEYKPMFEWGYCIAYGLRTNYTHLMVGAWKRT